MTFRYKPESPPVLHGVSLEVRAGEMIGIVGRSGSGKSTLTKLIQRLYVPEQGRVRVDGTDISLIDAAQLRRQVGVVLQENVLFNRSVRENIAIADPAAPLQAVLRVAQLTNPRILILDEATSALDYESETALHQNMAAICQGCTVIVIAHRLSAVRQAHRIMVMERGRIVEAGATATDASPQAPATGRRPRQCHYCPCALANSASPRADCPWPRWLRRAKRASASNSASNRVAISSISRFTLVPRRLDKAFSLSYLSSGRRMVNALMGTPWL